MRKKILILGASGFIGRQLVTALAGTDWAQPLAASRGAELSVPEGAQWLRFDATDGAALVKALQGVDGVVNCIAGSVKTMVASSQLLFSLAKRLQTRPRIVHMSSMAVYGEASGRVDESAPLVATDPYGRAKILTEQLGAEYGPWIILRPGIVYGPYGRQWTARVSGWLRSRRLGDLGVNGDGYCNLLYVGDLVSAVMQALQLSDITGKSFNLAMSQPPTWNEYFVAFARALGAVPVERVGHRRLQLEGKLIAPPLKIAQILIERARIRGVRLPEPIPPSFMRLCRQEIRLDVTAAEADLKLRWTGLEEGLRQSALWCASSRS